MTNQTAAKPLPASFVPKAEINKRVNNFMTFKHPLLTAELGKAETKSVWYATLHLEQLIDELKYKEASGLRIYLGAYSDDHPNYAGQLCLLMVPTRADGQTLGHFDIIAEEEPDFPERFAGFDPGEIGRIYKTFNFGSPCPPACPPPDGLTFPY